MVLPAACRQAQLVARPAAPSGGRGRASHPAHSAPGSAGDFHLCLCAPELQAPGFLLSAAMPKPSSLPPGVALWWVSVFAPSSCTPLATFQSSQASCLLPTPCHHTMVPPTVPISVPAMLLQPPRPSSAGGRALLHASAPWPALPALPTASPKGPAAQGGCRDGSTGVPHLGVPHGPGLAPTPLCSPRMQPFVPFQTEVLIYPLGWRNPIQSNSPAVPPNHSNYLITLILIEFIWPGEDN